MPVYNSAKYLAEAIESILGQSFRDFELIIVNDGSPDESSQIVARYAENDSRIVFVDRKENHGVVYTRNEMLAKARGEWMATMDGDDIAAPDRFKVQLAFLEQHPEYILLASAAVIIDPDGNAMCEMGGERTHEEIDQWHMAARSGSAFVSPTTMMRTVAVRAAGGYRDHDGCAEDYDLFLRLAERGKLYSIPNALLYYRQHLDSIGYKDNRRQREGIRCAVQEAYQRRKLPMPADLFDKPIPNRSASYAYRQWSEWSLRGGNVALARRYGLKAIIGAPWSPRTWGALAQACAPEVLTRGARNRQIKRPRAASARLD